MYLHNINIFSLLFISLVKNFIALLSYRLLLLLLLPILFLFILLRSRSQKAYRERLLERFGLLNRTFSQTDIVIHAASVGEVLALRPLVEQLIQLHPKKKITFTTFTPTGSEQVQKLFADKVQHCYLPLDLYFANWLFLQKLKPSLIVFMETELWPCFVAQAKKRHCKLLLINARLSQSSVNAYSRLSWLFSPCIQGFDKILAQSQDNLVAFQTLGAEQKRCSNTGNIKYDITLNEHISAKIAQLKSCIPAGKKIWVMASTHPGDEEIALRAFASLMVEHPALLLVIVPRHPERFKKVALLAQQFSQHTITRSSNEPLTNASKIWVLDTLGELIALYGVSDIVSMGGSFSDVEGHNPLEPAYFKKPVIVGPRMKNFAEITTQLMANNGLISLKEDDLTSSLSNAVKQLMNNEAEQKALGQNAYNVVLENQGAITVTLEEISQQLKEKNRYKPC